MSQRGSIFLEDATVIEQQAHEADQYVLRVRAPKAAARAEPGNFAHVQCDPRLPMRRPMSIMRADAEGGWIEFLYKVVGEGTRLLSERRVGDVLSVLAPIGQGFSLDSARPRALLLGGGVGIPPMVFLADHLRRRLDEGFIPLVLMGSEVPFPFRTRPSRLAAPGVPRAVTAAMPLLEDWGITSRLASLRGYPGCFEGYVTDLGRQWLEAMSERERHAVSVFACGPEPMLEAAAALAREFELPCQLSLEEFMACAVGGCAGCVVRVRTSTGPAMRRVCVDGPVFDASSIYPRPA